MEQIDVEAGPPRRIELGPDRRAAALVGVLLVAYAAVLVYLRTAGALALGPKGYVILGASMLTPVLMLGASARRTFRLDGDRLFVSGPFGIGGAARDVERAELDLVDVRVAGQPSHRLTWTYADGTTQVMSTYTADRYPLVEAMRRAMSPGASPTSVQAFAELARQEVAQRRRDLVRFTIVACVSIGAGAAWLAFGPSLFG